VTLATRSMVTITTNRHLVPNRRKMSMEMMLLKGHFKNLTMWFMSCKHGGAAMPLWFDIFVEFAHASCCNFLKLNA